MKERGKGEDEKRENERERKRASELMRKKEGKKKVNVKERGKGEESERIDGERIRKREEGNERVKLENE